MQILSNRIHHEREDMAPAGKTWWQKQEPGWSHFYSYTRSKETEQEVGPRLESIKTQPHWYTSTSRYPTTKGSITFPNSATNWGPSVQIQETMRDISFTIPTEGKTYILREHGWRLNFTWKELLHWHMESSEAENWAIVKFEELPVMDYEQEFLRTIPAQRLEWAIDRRICGTW